MTPIAQNADCRSFCPHQTLPTKIRNDEHPICHWKFATDSKGPEKWAMMSNDHKRCWLSHRVFCLVYSSIWYCNDHYAHATMSQQQKNESTDDRWPTDSQRPQQNPQYFADCHPSGICQRQIIMAAHGLLSTLGSCRSDVLGVWSQILPEPNLAFADFCSSFELQNKALALRSNGKGTRSAESFARAPSPIQIPYQKWYITLLGCPWYGCIIFRE